MNMSSSPRRGPLWKTDWFAGLMVVVFLLLIHAATDVVSSMESRFYDMASTSNSRVPSDRIAVIAIDDQSIGNIGRWPWARDVHAQLIDLLSAAKAKTIVHTTLFLEPQTDRGLVYVRKIKEAIGVEQPGTDAIARIIAEAEAALDTDAVLATSLGKARNVLLPSVYQLGVPLGKADAPLPAFALKSTIDDPTGFTQPALRGQQPIALLGDKAAGVAHLNQWLDPDGAVRREPLFVNFHGRAVPSMALAAAAHSLNLGVSDMRLVAGESVQLGRLTIKTDAGALMLPQFYHGKDGRAPFPVDSFYDVVSGKIPASKYADKIVLIGATAAGVGIQFTTPASPGMAPAEIMAHMISSILNEHFIVQPTWAGVASLCALLGVIVYLLVALPRLSAGVGAIATAGLMLLLLSTEYGLLAFSATWITLVLPAVVLLAGHLALTTKRFLMTEAGKQKSDEESAETNRMMGLALQGQGQFDMAFDRFRRVPLVPGVGDAVMDNLYNLALDFERKRQFNKAQAVYEYMATYNKSYKDLQAKLNRAKNLSETVILGGGSGHPGGTVLLDGGAVEKPMLGRYQVEKELGKGAMGVVYLGKDPKIGRVVAIKTLALSQEFEGSELDDARERFFREAETAGRLQHQNIVTIFDAGEEHDLAYIAMEFLKGKDMVDYCREGSLLPVPKVLSIVARVAEALAYAHRQGVVHRDIKPANIMYELESDVVKVTDFGIARITDSSKTKTGIVLGTPSFMSPEQIAGKKVDGRSDLYSLGVMLYQMLAGTLPFRGDSMAELMYKIANEEAPDILRVKPGLPPKLAEIVALALTKRADVRYQTGEQLAMDLKAMMVEMAVPGHVSLSVVHEGGGAGVSAGVGLAAQPRGDFAATTAFEKTQAGPPGFAATEFGDAQADNSGFAQTQTMDMSGDFQTDGAAPHRSPS
jgi:eukaryotic-like serine/threonine-protein kinase